MNFKMPSAKKCQCCATIADKWLMVGLNYNISSNISEIFSVIRIWFLKKSSDPWQVTPRVVRYWCMPVWHSHTLMNGEVSLWHIYESFRICTWRVPHTHWHRLGLPILILNRLWPNLVSLNPFSVLTSRKKYQCNIKHTCNFTSPSSMDGERDQ